MNEKLYFEIYKKRTANTEPERYCFALNMFLGHNELFPNHSLKGKTFIDEEGIEWSVDDVYVHYFRRYYYLALARNSHNSHCSITWNINSKMEDIDNIQHYKLKEE